MSKEWKEEIITQVKQRLNELEKEGQKPKDVAELEAMVMNFTKGVGSVTWEKLVEGRAKEKISPRLPNLSQANAKTTSKTQKC